MAKVLVRIHNNQDKRVTKWSVQNDVSGVVSQWMEEIRINANKSIEENLTNIKAKLIEKGASILNEHKEPGGYCSVIEISIPIEPSNKK